MIDVEILIPIDKKFINSSYYNFKQTLRLINCVKFSHRGTPLNFQNAVNEVQRYILDNKLTPISSLYTVIIEETERLEKPDDFHADIYVSINPNII
ncbi:hypothetical protein GCM10022410_01920 [Amphibacillus indicireducens]|uniref:GyrI-like small molecule binding domain-containing protein n=1 Tax=Amphibacillus indicireducens TaxID=1076330 RepID=A0ABP7V3L6_9BACI